jgi:uncharacterized protein (DUF362 family)
MDAVSREFEGELAALRSRWADQPRREILELLLIALEREHMVTLSYRERLMSARLERTPLSSSLRDLIRHALVWVWKDEEMHAVFVRGLLFKLGGPLLKLKALVHQVNGLLGGWASGIRLHVPWSRAPLLRAAATALQWMGVVAGKVPREVRRELDYRPFRRFCEFNVDAERTAALCFERLAALGPELLPPETVDELGRMKRDEDNHCRVFEAIGAALDEGDRLAPGATEEELASRLRAVGEEFLPRARRAIPRSENPLGTGGRVAVRAGGDRRARFREALEAAGLPEVLARRSRGFRAAVKASFMMGYDRRDRSTHVDPALAEELALYLREHGAGDVALCEGRNIYDRFYRNRSVPEVARYLGFASRAYRVVDLTDEQVPHRYSRGMAQFSVGRTWKEADVRIVFGKLKSHPVDAYTLALSGLEGVGPRNDAYLFADRQAQRSVAIMTAISDFPPHFAVVDAWDAVPDGILGMMGSVHTKSPRRFYAAEDPAALDGTAARHLGGLDPRASSMYRDACSWFGDPADRTVVDGPDEPIRGWRGPYDNDLSALLSSFAQPFYTFFTGRGALFVSEMDERAFPPAAPEGAWLRAARRSFQTLLILRHMK